MRGIPGSGKSTYAERAVDTLPSDQVGAICSADNFFINESGEYKFDLSKIGLAHASCFDGFLHGLRTMKAGYIHLLVVDNTNVKAWELSPYIQLAKHHRFDLEVVRFHIDPAIAGPRNKHGVPQEAVDRMAKGMERLPPALGREIVISLEA